LGDRKYDTIAYTRAYSSSPTIDRFDKILLRKGTLEDMGADFDHKSFRSKKAMLEEIKYVYFLLFVGNKKQCAVSDMTDVQIRELEAVAHKKESAIEGLVMPTASATNS
jgi:hypothetical protein